MQDVAVTLNILAAAPSSPAQSRDALTEVSFCEQILQSRLINLLEYLGLKM
jgi:hypothetical protein